MSTRDVLLAVSLCTALGAFGGQSKSGKSAATATASATAPTSSDHKSQSSPQKPFDPRRRRWTFDQDQVGAPPSGWTAGQTNADANQPVWQVAGDATAPSLPNVLSLAKSTSTGATFNLMMADRTSYDHLDLSASVKALSGEEDQGGGILWRCLGINDYYVCRINPLEGNIRAYRVIGGRREQIASARVTLVKDRWYALRVTMSGTRVTCYLDGRQVLAVSDDKLRQPGMIGLWTKADARSNFDDVAVEALPEQPR